MNFSKPVVVYTAEKNVEAHMIVEMLISNGIDAYADEDQSGVSLWAMGTLGQFHRPLVWIDAIDVAQASVFVKEFEAKKRQRLNPPVSDKAIDATCEKCETTTPFSAAVDGTVQVCPKCKSYVDVGTFELDVSGDDAD